jgi:4-alpha-glucanotransferase
VVEEGDQQGERNREKYLRFTREDNVHWEFICAATASMAKTAIIPMQDVMGLDNNSRMNIPATQAGNWGWRVGEADVFDKLHKEKKKLRRFLCRYNRLMREFAKKCKAERKGKKRKRSDTPDSIGTTISKSLEGLGSIGKAFAGQETEGDAQGDAESKDRDPEREGNEAV